MEHVPAFISKPSGNVDLENREANPSSSKLCTDKMSRGGNKVPDGNICLASNSLAKFSIEFISKLRVIINRDWPSIIIESDIFEFKHLKIIICGWRAVELVRINSTKTCLVSQEKFGCGSESRPNSNIFECRCFLGLFVGPIDNVTVAVAKTIGCLLGSFLIAVCLVCQPSFAANPASAISIAIPTINKTQPISPSFLCAFHPPKKLSFIHSATFSITSPINTNAPPVTAQINSPSWSDDKITEEKRKLDAFWCKCVFVLPLSLPPFQNLVATIFYRSRAATAESQRDSNHPA